jgi:hypothetical protein
MEFRSVAILLVVLACLDAKGEMFVAEGYRLETVGVIAGEPGQRGGDYLGEFWASIAISGDTVAASVTNGVRRYDSTTGASGSSYVPPVPTGRVFGGDHLGGVGVVADEHYTLVGGISWQPINGRNGLAHLYDTASGDFVRTLYCDQPLTSHPYLRSVAYDGRYAVISMLEEEGPGVYVFDIESGEQVAKLVDPSNGLGNFGASIAIDSGIVVVGSPYELSADEDNLRGAVYTFDASTGSMINRWMPPSNDANGFGIAVAADEGVVIVGNDRSYTGPWTPPTSSNGSGVPDYQSDLGDDDYVPQEEPAGIVYALDLHDGTVLSTMVSSDHPYAYNYDTSEFGFTLRLSGHLAVVSAWDSNGNGEADGTPVSVYDVRNGQLIASLDEDYYGGIAIDGNRIAAVHAWGTGYSSPAIKVFAIIPEPNAALLAMLCLATFSAARGRRAA